jgi:large subunit ribosomal protein L20
MPRAQKGAALRRKHKRVMKAARGYYGVVSRRYKLALQKTFRGGVYASRDRHDRKRDFRRLWITRISAACEQRGFRYSQLIHAMAQANVTLNRKMLSEIAIADPAAFDALLQKVLGGVAAKA